MVECKLNLARYFAALPKVGIAGSATSQFGLWKAACCLLGCQWLMPGDIDSSETVLAQKPKAVGWDLALR
jgi:hypothetical protein